MDKTQKRYDFLDLFKCIAMLMIVSLHTGLWHTNFLEAKSIGSFIQYCIYIICGGVPIFVLINGFLTLNKDVSIKKHCKKMLKILFLIVFWSAFSYLFYNIANKNSFTMRQFINNTLLFDINNVYNGPLWFLQNLLMLYFIYPIINYVYKNHKKLFYYLFLVVTFFTFINGVLTSVSNIYSSTYIQNINVFIKNINPLQNALFVFYFLLGGVLFDKIEIFKTKKYRILLILIGVVSYAFSIVFTTYIFRYKGISFSTNYIYGRIPLAFVIVGLFSLIYGYKNNNNRFYNKIIKSIGENTLGIFLIHVPLRNLLLTLRIINASSLISRVLAFFMVFIISYLLTLVIKKIPIIKNIIKL